MKWLWTGDLTFYFVHGWNKNLNIYIKELDVQDYVFIIFYFCCIWDILLYVTVVVPIQHWSEKDNWDLCEPRVHGFLESEDEAVTWVCQNTKLRTSLITWLWQNESRSETGLHCEMLHFFDRSFEASVSNVTSLLVTCYLCGVHWHVDIHMLPCWCVDFITCSYTIKTTCWTLHLSCLMVDMTTLINLWNKSSTIKGIEVLQIKRVGRCFFGKPAINGALVTDVGVLYLWILKI